MNAETEQELAVGVQAAKARLLALLPEGDRDTVRKRGSEDPVLFEDHARARAAWHREHGGPVAAQLAGEIEARLADFQRAVNALWTHVVQSGLPVALASEWRRKNRAKAAGIAKDDIEAEVIFVLRGFVIRFDPKAGEKMFSYAYRGVLQHLTEWSAQQVPVQVPQKAAREMVPALVRTPLGDAAYDPWTEVDDYLDGEIDGRDL